MADFLGVVAATDGTPVFDEVQRVPLGLEAVARFAAARRAGDAATTATCDAGDTDAALQRQRGIIRCETVRTNRP